MQKRELLWEGVTKSFSVYTGDCTEYALPHSLGGLVDFIKAHGMSITAVKCNGLVAFVGDDGERHTVSTYKGAKWALGY